MRANKKRSRIKTSRNPKKLSRAEPTAEASKVVIELNVDENKYDISNPLVLPASKSIDNVAQVAPNPIQKVKKKKLSKKKEKKLRKIVERKRKLQDRKTLIEELKKHQLDSKMYSAMTSTSQMQSKGHKRLLIDCGDIKLVEEPSTKIKTMGKIRRKPCFSLDSKILSDPNCIGFDKSEDEESQEESDVVKTPVKTEEKLEELVAQDKAELKELSIDCTKAEPTKGLETESVTLQKPSPKKMVDTADKKESLSKSSSSSKIDPHQIITKYVAVHRTPEIENSRSKLPIISEEQMIMETIRYNSVTIICGETGSGKTTQIPQFLYEAGYACDKKIGITEPRRVAAIAMSRRIAAEMNLSSDIVSYQIRFEGNCTDDTKIKFMTDGILFKEVQQDPLLNNYSVIIIDEAHERTVYSDILIGWLSRVIRLRTENPLKLVIMSATLRISDFCENPRLFQAKPPVIKIESRQFPVSIHFSKKTPEDYIHEAYLKVCKIHRKEPKGGAILVFVTGQQEVINLCQKLRRTFPHQEEKPVESRNFKEKPDEQKDDDSKKLNKKLKTKTKPRTLDDIMPAIDLDSYVDDVDFDDEVSDEEEDDHALEGNDEEAIFYEEPLYCLPLYSNLHEKKQQLVFQSPPTNCRLCVVATNVAETSLTIPNVRYVVDTGKVKIKLYDQITGISKFIIGWTSKASADQRAGRAGRIGPGHCYRLYSSAVFNDNFNQFSDPEIVKKPVDDLVLQMKSMNIDNVVNFPFPSPPNPETLIAAEKRLVLLGALEETFRTGKVTKNFRKSRRLVSRRITKLGKVMASFPLNPRYSKILILAAQHNLMIYAIYIVAGLTIQEIFIESYCDSSNSSKDRVFTIKRLWAGKGNSLLLGDMMVILTAIGGWIAENHSITFCEKFRLRFKAMNEIRKLVHQLMEEALNIKKNSLPNPPTDEQAKCLRQAVLSGLFDKVARKMPLDGSSDGKTNKNRHPYQSIELDAPVFIPNNSVLNILMPEWVVYQEIFETARPFMRNVVAIEPEWLPIYASSLCTYSKPLTDPEPRYDPAADCIKCTVNCTFGPHGWEIPNTEIEYPDSLGVEKFRWFASHLLEGNVINYFKKRRNLYLSQPKIIHASWAKLQQRTQFLLESLFASKVCSKKKLKQQWITEPHFLLKEYCKWLPEAVHRDVENEWPPIKIK